MNNFMGGGRLNGSAGMGVVFNKITAVLRPTDLVRNY